MITLTKDLEFSHSFLSYLLAGLQGQFAYLNILSRIGAQPPNRETIGRVQQEIDEANGWLRSSLDGQPLFELTWQTPETDNARKAFEVAKRLGKDLHELSGDLDSILEQRQFNEIARDRIVLLLAALGRHTYARDNYLRCFYSLFEELGDKEEAKRYRTGVKSSEKDVEYTNGLITAYQQNAQLPLEFYHSLFGEVIALPGLMRTQLFDLKMMWCIYDGPFSYALAEIPNDRAEQWVQLGISPIEAGYWEAYLIYPVEALVWLQGGITEYAIAGLWKSWRYPPDEAIKWITHEFSPADGATWANAGFDAEEARQLINRGVSHPSLIKG